MIDNHLYDCCPNDEFWSCDSTDGSILYLTRLTCASCGYGEYCSDDSDPEELFWSSHDECYYCGDCCCWVDVLDDYVHNDDIVDCVDEDDCSFIDARWDIEQNSDYIEHKVTYYHINSEYARENLV